MTKITKYLSIVAIITLFTGCINNEAELKFYKTVCQVKRLG